MAKNTNGRGTAFDGETEWLEENEFARKAAPFGVDNSSSKHYLKKNNGFVF